MYDFYEPHALKMDNCVSLLSYKGKISFDKVNDLLDDYQRKMPATCSVKCRTRLYSIVVECLENAYRHNIEGSDYQVTVDLWNQQSDFVLFVENKIKNDEIGPLANYIERINAASPAELKKLYFETIYHTTISEKGGARVGLMKIRRCASQPIKYEFVAIDNNISLFNIIVRISDVYQADHNDNELYQNSRNQNVSCSCF